MLILPPGHARSLHARRPLAKREKWMIGGVLGAVAAVVVALVISFVIAAPSSGNGCIYVTIPGPIGANEINQCGDQARGTCAETARPGVFTASAAAEVAAACRKAGIRVATR